MWPASWNLRLGILGLAVVPLALTLLAFIELALVPPEQIIAGTPLSVTATLSAPPTPTADPGRLYVAGLQAFDAGELESAELLVRAALAQTPRQANWRNTLGLILARQGRQTEAAEAFQAALDDDATLTEAQYNLGAAYDAMRDTTRALAAYQAAIRADPEFAPAYVGLGNVLQDQGELAQALAAYEKAVALDPDLATARLNLGVAFANSGDWASAVKHLERAVVLRPDHAASRYSLGVAYLGLGQTEPAVRELQVVVTLDPTGTWGAQATQQLAKLAP